MSRHSVSEKPRATEMGKPKSTIPRSSRTISIEEFYADHPYPSFGEKGLYAYIKMKRQLLKELGVPYDAFRNKSILEAGCGTGESTISFATLGTKRAVGVDLSGPAITRANLLAHQLGYSNIEFRQSDIQDLNFSDGEFDVVISESVHMTDDPIATMRGLAKLVSPHGYLVLSIGNVLGFAKERIQFHLANVLATGRPERRMKIAKWIFFNRATSNNLCRGVRQSDWLDLDAAIVDIFGHPSRQTFFTETAMRWCLALTDFEVIGTRPARPMKKAALGGLRADWSMLKTGQIHFDIALRRNNQ